MRWTLVLICTPLLGIAAAISEAADAPIASIKIVTGTASVVRQGAALVAEVNTRILPGDTLKTGGDGALGVLFADDTSLSLGPNSELAVDEFLFAPAQGKLGFVMHMLKGTAAYVSGIIARLAPQSVRIDTPVASIGIRGTRILLMVDDQP